MGELLYLEGEKMQEFTEISSKDNAVFKLITGLNGSSKKRLKEGLFIIEGLRICYDAFENGIEIDKLIFSNSARIKHKNDIEILSKKAKKCYLISDNLFLKISDTVSPQGIIIIGKIPENNYKINSNGRYIAVENLQDPSNFGAISRSAEALGVNGIVVTSNGCDPYSPKVLRASMGTVLRMPIFITDNLIDFANNNGLRTVSCVVDKSAQNIKDFNFKNGDILLIGNEGNGLTAETKDKSDNLVTIKMTGKAESLNAASAAAIAMWEMIK